MPEEMMTLGERIRRHPGLTMKKRIVGEVFDTDAPDWNRLEWNVTIRLTSPGGSGIEFTTPFITHVSRPQDGSDITLGSVLESVLGDVAIDEEHTTYESYCEEFQPDRADSREGEQAWLYGRHITGEAINFFHAAERYGGDSFQAWVYETDRGEYEDGQ